MFIYYDNSFNQNEWFVIILLLFGLLLAWKFRKGFSIKEALIYFLYSYFIGMFFDHTISVEPFDLYDVNDNSSYQFIDFLTYLMYGPFGYLYVYFYDRFKIRFSYAPLYVLMWALFSTFVEFVSCKMNVFHYKNGYTIFYSFPIYLLTLSVALFLYKLIHSTQEGN